MRTLATALLDYYLREPERAAVILQHPDQPDLALPYRELVERANDYAMAYARAGIRPGDMVVLILPHGQELVHAFWGAILLGAVPSMMSFLTEKLAPDRYQEDMGALFSISSPAAVVTYPEFEATCRQMIAAGRGAAPALLVAGGLPRQARPDLSALPGLNRRETDLAVLQHSSGSTGLQKGVALSHRAIFNQLDAMVQTLGLTRHDAIVSWLPLYHDMGLVACFLMPVLCGVPVIQMSPFDWVREPWRLPRAVSDYRATIAFMPNFAFHFCANKVREQDIAGADLSSWRLVISGGEPAKARSLQMFHERFQAHGLRREALQVGYGMAETVFAATATCDGSGRPPRVERIDRKRFIAEHRAESAEADQPCLEIVSCGRPLPNTRIRVVDNEGRELGERQVGEVVLQSDCLLSEYYRRPDLAGESFTPDGWFKSGDYGYISEGELFVAGRRNDMIIVAGKNVYPQDLEAIAGEVPGVHPGRTVAFGLYDEAHGTEVVAIVAEVDTEDEGERERIAGEIRAHVTRNSAVAVRHVRAVGAKWVLKTSSGKVARAANKEKYIRESGPDQESLRRADTWPNTSKPENE